MVRVEKKEYVFEGPDGNASLLDLFDGRRQLIVYHHMLHSPEGWPQTRPYEWWRLHDEYDA